MTVRQQYAVPNVRCGAVWFDKKGSQRCRRRARQYVAGYYVMRLVLGYLCPQHFTDYTQYDKKPRGNMR